MMMMRVTTSWTRPAPLYRQADSDEQTDNTVTLATILQTRLCLSSVRALSRLVRMCDASFLLRHVSPPLPPAWSVDGRSAVFFSSWWSRRAILLGAVWFRAPHLRGNLRMCAGAAASFPLPRSLAALVLARVPAALIHIQLWLC